MAAEVKPLTFKQEANQKKVKLVRDWLAKNAQVRELGKQILVARTGQIASLNDVMAIGERGMASWFGRAKRYETQQVTDFDTAMKSTWPTESETEDENGGE